MKFAALKLRSFEELENCYMNKLLLLKILHYVNYVMVYEINGFYVIF